jgi:hypothetical protein
VAVAPTADRFTWRAESRLLVAAEGMIWPRSLLTAADRQVVIESTAGGEAKVRLSAALAEAG